MALDRTKLLMYSAVVPYTLASLAGAACAPKTITPTTQNLSVRTQEIQEPNLSRELADLVDTNQGFLSSAKIVYDHSKNLDARLVSNTAYGALQYIRRTKTKQEYDATARYRENLKRNGDLLPAEADSSPQDPVGTIEEIITLEKSARQGDIDVWIKRVDKKISLGISTRNTDIPFTDIYDDVDLNGKFDHALDRGVQKGIPFHGYDKSEFVDAKAMLAGEFKDRQLSFEELLRQITLAVKNYLKLP